jgi:transcriptional regulator GlxA family with amidase domain
LPCASISRSTRLQISSSDSSAAEIAEVAFECGYTSLARLYDAFQKRLGKTPRHYRLEFHEGRSTVKREAARLAN